MVTPWKNRTLRYIEHFPVTLPLLVNVDTIVYRIQVEITMERNNSTNILCINICRYKI